MKLDNVEDIYALSPLQAGMLYHAISEPGTGVFINQIVSTISSTPQAPFDHAAFEAAWDRLVQRHPVLRTAFLWDGLDEPLQVVRQQVSLPWRIEDWRDTPAASQAERLEQWLVDDRQRGFEPATAPLLRMSLIRVDDMTWRWLWSFHHLVLDGWSARLLLRELEAIHATGAGGLAPAFPYSRFIAWQADQDLGQAETYWRQRLAGFEATTRIEDPLRAGGGTAQGEPSGVAQVQTSLSTDHTTALTRFAAQHHLTASTVLQGAWAQLLGRYTRDRDIVFGVTMATRPPMLGGIEDAVGVFINTLPLRVDTAPNTPVAAWLQALQRAQLEAQAHAYSPLEAVQRWSDVDAGEPLFDSIVVFENHPSSTDELATAANLVLGAPRFIEQSNYPLALLVVPGPRLELILVYDHARFQRRTTERILHHLEHLLASFIDAPTRPVGDLPMMGEDERQRLLVTWNNPAATGPDTGSPAVRIHDLIRRAGRRAPDTLAVITDTETSTYREVLARSQSLAAHLRHLGVGPDVLVGLYVTRSTALVVGIVAILEAGGAYVPLDPTYPSDHLRFIVEDAGSHLVLTDMASEAAQAATFRDLPRVPLLVDLGDPDSWVAPADGAPADVLGDGSCDAPTAPRADHLAYVIYTSGSSGRPKGVMVSHGNVVHSTRARLRDQQDDASRRFMLLSSFAFDSSVAGLFGTLCAGDTLVLPSPGTEHDLDAIHQLVERHRVTHTLCLPALYRLLLEETDRRGLATLETVIVAGEACPSTLAQQHHAQRPGSRLVNEYGPTEATVWSTVHEVTPADARGPVPIGQPIANSRVFVLDPWLAPVPVGVAGELYLAGDGIARGYLGRPGLTAERFIPAPVTANGVGFGVGERVYRSGDLARWRADGRLIFLGRADRQIKIRGHRVEPDGVAALLRRYLKLADAAVIATSATPDTSTPGSATRARLHAYLVPAAGSTLDPEPLLRRTLEERMPSFMVPDTLVLVPRLPRLPNGKLDVAALPDAADGVAKTDRSVAPGSDIEHALASIWSTLLGVETVGIHDNFYALGGDSILGIQAVSRMRQAGFAIEPRDLAHHPTIVALARIAERTDPAATTIATAATSATQEDQPPVTGSVPLMPIQTWFFARGLAAPAHWNLSRLFAVAPDFDPACFSAALAACYRHHDMLRARFTQAADAVTEGVAVAEGAWHQQVEAPSSGSIPLEVIDLPAQATDTDTNTDIEHRWLRAQSALNLMDGPLIRALLLRRGPETEGLLLLAIHHLIIDAVSWSVLVDDLELAYAQHASKAAITLPSKTTSYQHWSTALAEKARDDTTLGDPTDGTASLDPASFALPVDHQSDRAATEADARTVRRRLDAARTTALTGPALAVYDLRIDEPLITALLITMRRWRHHDTLCLDLEHHGREVAGIDLDVSRTVGWFTVTSSVSLVLAEPDLATPGVADPEALGRALQATRKQLRMAPTQGIGSDDTAQQPTARVLFNYLSRLDGPTTNGTLRPIAGGEASARDPRNARSHLLELNAGIRGGRLEVEWIYAQTVHQQATIEGLARDFTTTLERLIDHCLSEEGVSKDGALEDGRTTVEDIHRLTGVQEALLLHRLQHGTALDSGFLLISATLEGRLNQAALEAAWARTLARHPSLRGTIRWRDIPHPVQVVSTRATLPIRHEDWRSLSAAEQSDRWQAHRAAERRAGIDIGITPVARLTVMRTADTTHRLSWACHHLLLDGWSSALVLDEVLRRYYADVHADVASEADAAQPPPFRAYVDAIRAQDDDPAAFWRDTPLAPADLTTGRLLTAVGRPPAAPSNASDATRTATGAAATYATTSCSLAAVDPSRLDAWARRHQVTASCLFVGCWGLTIAEATGHPRAVFGLTVSGRTVPIEGIENLVGMCANALPMGVDVDPDQGLETWFQAILSWQQTLQPFEHVALGPLLSAGGYTSRLAPFDSLLAFANYPGAHAANLGNTGLRLHSFAGDITSTYPMTVAVTPGQPYRVTLRYDRVRLEEQTGDALIHRFAALIETVLAGDVTTLRGLSSTASEPLPDHLIARSGTAVPTADRYQAPVSQGTTVVADASHGNELVEAQLMRIWNDLIAYQEIGLDDNFFHLGGHSLLVPPMIERVERDLGMTLPLAAVFARPTIRALATVIAERAAAPNWPALVPIRDQGDQPPLFLVHGLGGEVSWFYSLAPHLPPSRPLLGLQAPAKPYDDLPAMARHYLEELRGRQPDGPYYLGGYCTGGSVAFEMAQQLVAAGERVAFLGLIDSVPQSHAKGAPVALPAMLFRRAKHLLSKRPADILRSTRDAARRTGHRLQKRDPGRPVELEDVLDMTTLPTVYRHAATRHFRAVRDYRPTPFDGDVWLFRSHDPRFGDDFGWRGLTHGTLHIELVGGNHIEVLQEPHVTGLGRKLAAALTTCGGS